MLLSNCSAWVSVWGFIVLWISVFFVALSKRTELFLNSRFPRVFLVHKIDVCHKQKIPNLTDYLSPWQFSGTILFTFDDMPCIRQGHGQGSKQPQLLPEAEFFSLLWSIKLFQEIKIFTVFYYLYLKLCLMKIINKYNL